MPYSTELLSIIQQYNNGEVSDTEALILLATQLIEASRDPHPNRERDALMTFLQKVLAS